MNAAQNVEERFALDVEHHALTVQLDDGLHRHLVCRQPATIAYWFEIVTAPGLLVVNGDMGAFAFSRLPDMFEFFGGGPRINPSYWAEKLVADSGVRMYSPDAARHVITSEWRDQIDGASEALADATWQDIELEVLSEVHDEANLREALRSFRSKVISFEDAWEWDFQVFSPRYLWCLHAIVWAISRYRAAAAVAS